MTALQAESGRAERRNDGTIAAAPVASLTERVLRILVPVAMLALLLIVWQVSRDDGDAVIALLAVHQDMLVAAAPKRLVRKIVGAAFDLLKTQDIRPIAVEKPADEVDAQPYRIDVPGRD